MDGVSPRSAAAPSRPVSIGHGDDRFDQLPGGRIGTGRVLGDQAVLAQSAQAGHERRGTGLALLWLTAQSEEGGFDRVHQGFDGFDGFGGEAAVLVRVGGIHFRVMGWWGVGWWGVAGWGWGRVLARGVGVWVRQLGAFMG
ncbi:hypothetical protein ACFVTC_10745 [Streptomyces sp. NPDC057950]|uniref:hypothetical protein n=1 Tax=Streptomyces sp. NPDC057950 TaxID=3346288 RepID=UPI0036E09153